MSAPKRTPRERLLDEYRRAAMVGWSPAYFRRLLRAHERDMAKRAEAWMVEQGANSCCEMADELRAAILGPQRARKRGER